MPFSAQSCRMPSRSPTLKHMATIPAAGFSRLTGIGPQGECLGQPETAEIRRILLGVMLDAKRFGNVREGSIQVRHGQYHVVKGRCL